MKVVHEFFLFPYIRHVGHCPSVPGPTTPSAKCVQKSSSKRRERLSMCKQLVHLKRSKKANFVLLSTANVRNEEDCSSLKFMLSLIILKWLGITESFHFEESGCFSPRLLALPFLS